MKQTVKTQTGRLVKQLKAAGFNSIIVKSNHDGNSAYVKAYWFEDADDIKKGTHYADCFTDVRVSTHAPKAGGGFNGASECGFGECDIQISTVEGNLDVLAQAAFAARNDATPFKFNSKYESYEASI